MLGAEAIYSDEEKDSVGAQLMALYAIPSRVFDLPVQMADGSVSSIKVKLRLLNDKENEDVSEIADRYGPLSRVINERRAILARAIEWIENTPIQMPRALIQLMKDRGAEPTQVEQTLWVLEQSQSPMLDELIVFYDQLLDEQKVHVSDIKKKFETLMAPSQTGTQSFE
jgi:hypothetical protein